MGDGHLEVDVRRLALGPQTVLSDVSFDCPAGSHTAILGPNGAGKTTLLRAIVGLVRFNGRITLDGVEINKLPPERRAQRIAYVPQRSLLQSSLRVHDVVMQGRYAHQRAVGRPSAQDSSAVQHAMSVTDIATLMARRYTELSGGEQRRVLLARALATQADVIVLDEPTAALDIAHQLTFFGVLTELARAGRTIVTVLHDLRDAERFCQHAVVLFERSSRYHGSSLLPDTLVRSVYGVEPRPGGAAAYDLAGGGE